MLTHLQEPHDDSLYTLDQIVQRFQLDDREQGYLEKHLRGRHAVLPTYGGRNSVPWFRWCSIQRVLTALGVLV